MYIYIYFLYYKYMYICIHIRRPLPTAGGSASEKTFPEVRARAEGTASAEAETQEQAAGEDVRQDKLQESPWQERQSQQQEKMEATWAVGGNFRQEGLLERQKQDNNSSLKASS